MSLRPPWDEQKKAYKKGLDTGEARRRREDDLVEMRKSKRENVLHRIRSKLTPPQSFNLVTEPGTKLMQVSEVVEGMLSENSEKQLVATSQFIQLLSCAECFPHTEEAIKSRVIARLVEFLSRHDLPQLQLEAISAILGVAFWEPEQIAFLIQRDVILKLVQLYSSLHGDVRLQAGFALGKIASHSPSLRDVILSHGALLPLLAQFSDHLDLQMLIDLTWVLYNLCSGMPPAPFEQIKYTFQILPKVIYSSDEIILTNVCWILYYLSVDSNDGVQSVIEGRMCPRLIELLYHPSPEVVAAAINIICNIVDGNDAQTQISAQSFMNKAYSQFVVDGGVLPGLLRLLIQNQVNAIKIRACKAISSIMSKKAVQIQAVIDANIIFPLVQLMQNGEFDFRREAALAITNATFAASLEQIRYFVNQGCVKPLCDLLGCSEPVTVGTCLDGLDNILKAGKREKELGRTGGVNPYVKLIEHCGGYNRMENLLVVENDQNCLKKVKMLKMYWAEQNYEEVALLPFIF